METTSQNAANRVRAAGEGSGSEIDSTAQNDVSTAAQPSSLTAAEYHKVLHALTNIMTGLLMNAQLLDWKVPPYSRLKRYVREIERNAQRAAELANRLGNAQPPAEDTQPQDCLGGRVWLR